MHPEYDAMLKRVAKPARYTGQEWNSVVKDLNSVDVSVALAMPDVYEVGMSNLGLKILYEVLNREPRIAAERAYAPWVDMEAEMRSAGLTLCSLESQRPLATFDIVGFSLQYELSYTNVLNMLDLAGIPLLAEQRRENDPLVICGGPCTFNAEPMADFVDVFILGEGEEVLVELAQATAAWKIAHRPGGRAGILRRLASIGGVYVPALYDVTYGEDGKIATITPNCPEAPLRVTKRLVKDLDSVATALEPIVPYLDIIHNRIMLELFRGCTRGCRFCQAGILYRPVRERKPETLVKFVQQLVDSTGYDEISLVSLSSADYSCLGELINDLMTRFKSQGVSVSLPSLRVDSFSIDLAKQVQQVRKSGLTFAPEAGTQRLRDIINKGVTEQNLEDAVSAAFRSGWSTIKLYFMIGLPEETQEDVAGIAALAARVNDLYREIHGRRGAKVTVSISSFVPKPHTPFQWFGQNSVGELEEKQKFLRSLIRDRNISLNWHDARTSYLEGIFARGDRRLGPVILDAWRQGARFDGWSEHFRFDFWMQAFRNQDVDPDFYGRRQREREELLPWDHLSAGVSQDFLWREYQKALQGELTVDCRQGDCSACGVCQDLDVAVMDWGKQRQ